MGAASPVEAGHLPIDDFTLEDGDRAVVLTIGERAGALRPARCGGVQGRGQGEWGARGAVRSLAGWEEGGVYSREQPVGAGCGSGRETQLTTDGVEDFGYATDNAGWTHSARPILVWSPDSKKIATFQQDQRKTGEMYLVSTTAGHPTLEAWRYPLAGDEDVTMIERVIVDVDARKVVRLKMPPDQHRSSLCDDLSCAGGHGWDDVQWSEDGKQLAFVSTSRDHKQEWLRVADAATRRGARGDERDGGDVL